MLHLGTAEVIDDALESGPPEERVHALGCLPQVQRRVLIDRRVLAAFAYQVRLDAQAGEGVEEVAPGCDAGTDDPHVVMGGQGDLVLHGMHRVLLRQ